MCSQESYQLSPLEMLTPDELQCCEDPISHDIRLEEKRFEHLKNSSDEEKIKVLNIIIPHLETLSGLSCENFLSLVQLVGNHCYEDVRKEANYFRSAESRDLEKTLFSAPDILENKLKIEPLHVFFEACTRKSGRKEGEHREAIAGFQADFYESLLKGANLFSIPPFNFLKTSRILTKVPSKEVAKQNLGGSYTMHHNIAPAKQLVDTKVGPLISDNAQRGSGKFQHYGFGKLDRAAPVSVVTHNIRVESVIDRNDNAIFLDPKVAPFHHEFHPLFRPVGEEFFEVVEKRIDQEKEAGHKALNQILQHWIDETVQDATAGNGKTSYEKISERLNFGSAERKICCVLCHTIYPYDMKSQNICPNLQCQNNPTFYEDFEKGPYKKFGFPEKPPNTVIVNEVEPLPINPSGKANLRKLHDELKDKYWSEYSSFPFYGDGLPGVTFERMKSEHVYCTTHHVHVQLMDSTLLAEHCKSECSLGNKIIDLEMSFILMLYKHSTQKNSIIQ